MREQDYQEGKICLMPKPIIIAALMLAAMMLSLYLGIKSVDWLPAERDGIVTEGTLKVNRAVYALRCSGSLRNIG